MTTTYEPRAEILVNGSWVDVSGRLRRRSPVSVRRGRDDELAQATPSQLSMVLENVDGWLTPRNPESLYYPHWARGTRCRVWVDGGTTALIVPGVDGSNASTPDTAALDITGTITVLAWVDPEAWAGDLTYTGGAVTGGGFQRLVTKLNSPSDLSWQLFLTGPGWLSWEWSSNGTTIAGTRTTSKVIASCMPLWVGCTFRPNNGAGGNDILWFISEDGVTFEEIDSETVAGTSSIFSGAANVEIGTRNSGLQSYQGRVLGARVISGELAGTVVANPDFPAQTPGARSFTDSVGRVWSVNGTAEIATRTIRGVGQVDEIDVDWPHAERRDSPRDGVSHVSVTASGMMRRMGQGSKPIASSLYRKITSPSVAGNVKAYWPLEDGSDAKLAASPIDGVRPMNIGSPGEFLRFASDSSLPSSKPLPHTTSQIAFAGRVPEYSSTQSRVDVFARIDTPNVTPNGTFITAVEMSGTATRWTIAVDDTNVALVATDVNGGSLLGTTFASDARMFDTWVLWSLNLEQSGGNIAWRIDVVPVPLGLTFTHSGSFAGTVGTVTHLHNWNTPAPAADGISFGHMIVSTGLGLGWLGGADTAWVGETAAHRIYRLCAEENIPVHIIGDMTVTESFRGDELLSAPMGVQGQQSLLDLLTECAKVDGGILSEHRQAPVLDYRTRADLYNQPAAVTLNTNLGGIGREFTPVDDDQGFVNDVTATRPDGSSKQVTTNPPPGPGEVYDVDIPVNVEHDLQLSDQAAWRLHLGTWPAMRYPGLSTSLRTAGPTVAKAWSDIGLGDRVTLTNLPSQHEHTTDVLVEGYTETLSFFDWTAAINASPEGPWEVGVRDDDTLGIRDTAGSVLDASFAAGTATTMDVETTSGPLWAVTAASNSALPFDLDVAGYRIRCTAIGAAAGQVQTFTVSATIQNGLNPRTIAAGSPVSVWRPARRAL